MGHPQSYTNQAKSNSPNLSEVERQAFDHVGEQLAKMPGGSLFDLQSAAASYLSLFMAGAGLPQRREWIERKAGKWAAWWDEKHTAARQVRPHSQYSAGQALRGRTVAAIRKRGRTDWTALQAQLARQAGGTVAEVAAVLGCSRRYIFQLSKRRFPRLFVGVLVLALGVNVGKSSLPSTSEIQGIDQKETLRPFTLDEATPAHPPPVEKIDDLDAMGRLCHALRWHLSGQLLRSGHE